MSQIHQLSLTQLAAAIAQGRLSAREVSTAFLHRIEAHNPQLHAFLQVDAEATLAEADARDAHRLAGLACGALHGVPIAIKDIIDVEGYPTTGNSRITICERASRDAFVVAQLRRAGAVILGKTALHEFATGGPSFDLPWPPARNPWNRDHHPAGSSSGSGAAVAAEMIPGALGTDTAGSVRNPATACGIVGMKPSYGAISRSGVFPLAFSLDHIGPMTRTVADNALLYDACIGHDRQDPTSVARLEPVFAGLQASIRGMRIGVIEAFNAQAHPEIQASLAGAFKTLESLGAVLVPVQLPDLEAFSSSGRLIIQAESYAVHKAWMRSRAAEYGWRARTKILAGAFVDAASYIQAQQARRALCGAVEEVMRGVDALVCASSLELTSRIDDDAEVDRTYDRQARTPFNLTGSPAIAVPSGFASNGLPIGFQIVGKLFDEASVYRIAHAFEMAQPWAQHRPL